MVNYTAPPPPPHRLPAAVAIRGLQIRRGGNCLYDGLDLDLPGGLITGLLGPSGGGKSTLMRAIVGVQRIDSGSVTVLGSSAGSPDLRHRVAYGSQTSSVYVDLTVAENLRYFATLLRVPRSEVDRVLETVGLPELHRRLVGSLSGGQRGRVSLAIAMLGSPALLVLDEPTVGLDPILRESLWTVFRSLAEQGATLLVSSHVMDEALRCDELVLVHEGTVLAHSTPAALMDRTGTTDPDAAFLALVRQQAS